MQSNFCHTKTHPDCYVHNGKPYWSTKPPVCICHASQGQYIPDIQEQPIQPISTSTVELKQQISELRISLGNTNGMILQQRDQIHVLEKKLEADHHEQVRNHIRQSGHIVANYDDLVKRIEKLEQSNPKLQMHKDHYNNHEQLKHELQLIVQAQDSQCEEMSELKDRFDSYEKTIDFMVDDKINTRLKAYSNRLSALEQPEQYTNTELAERIEKLEDDSGQITVNTNHVNRIKALEQILQVQHYPNGAFSWELPKQCNPEKDGAIGALDCDDNGYAECPKCGTKWSVT